MAVQITNAIDMTPLDVQAPAIADIMDGIGSEEFG
jgi:hypothetical protein